MLDYPEVVEYDPAGADALGSFSVNGGLTREPWRCSLQESLANVRRLPAVP